MFSLCGTTAAPRSQAVHWTRRLPRSTGTGISLLGRPTSQAWEAAPQLSGGSLEMAE